MKNQKWHTIEKVPKSSWKANDVKLSEQFQSPIEKTNNAKLSEQFQIPI
jgi:hypothetical protein